MADRATIDTMNKVLDNLFGTKKYAGGTPQGVSPPGRGNPTQSQDRLKEYVDELLLAGMDPREVSNMLASSHATMKGRAFDELYIKQMTDDLQKHVQLRQQPLKPEIQSFQASRNPTVSNFLKIAATKGHTVDIDNVIKAFGINDPRMVESYKNEAYAARSQNAFPRLINFLKQFQNDPAKLASTLRTLKQVKTNNPIFEQISGIPQLGNTVARPVRMLVKATETGLGSSGMGLSQSQMRNYTKPSTPSANLSSISLPSNPAASTQRLAAQFVAEQRRQQAMQQSASLGQSLSRSNFLKTLARQNKPSGQASSVNLNFLGSRSTHQPTLFDRLRESKLGRRLGFESTNPVNYKAAGVGLAGGLSYLAMQYAPQAIDALSSGLAHMASGFFARGGSVPGYAYGGDPLRNIHLTKSPESASKLIGSNVVNSLQSDANSTGLYGLLQSMIKSGSTDASFRGLFYRKGLDANEWMEKVHQMKLQSADTFMNGYFAQGGVPRYAKGTSDEIPFNFKHFQIGRNSKFIKQMFDLSAPYMNDSDGQYQMFRAIENKKMGPKDFGLLAATLKDMNPVSALSYQSDGSGIEMTDLGTHPKFQKQGFGQILLAEMLNIGKDKGLDLATWSANSDAAAGYYNYLGAKEGENKSFTFDLNEWTGKFAKRRALGGDTFTQQLAQGPNSQLSADAIKRLQLLRIRAQAGQRLAGLRDNAQLNMQLGNTSLFRSPNTAAGVINARVLRNLESRFSGQPMGKFATGGIPRFMGGNNVYWPPGKHWTEVKDVILNRSRKLYNINDKSKLMEGFTGDSNPFYGRTGLNARVGETLGIPLPNLVKPDGHLIDALREGFGYTESDTNPYDKFIKLMSGDAISIAKDATLFRSISDRRFNFDEDGFLPPDPAYQHLSMSPGTSFAFGKNTIRTKLNNMFKNNIGYIGHKELEFITGRNTGWMDIGGGTDSIKNVIPVTAGEYAFNKFAKNIPTRAQGGSTYNNPIRVSDGELAIPRGMVDKIGLSTLRRINAGDMSGLQGFSAGGMFEFDGPGTGTSDSILTDADRGPKGQDASDIGFIIRRTSSDRLKSIVGRAMGGIIPGFIGGGNPFTDLTDFSNRLNARVADPKTGDNIFAMPRRTVVPQINSALAANPSGSATDIYKAILTSEKYLKTIQKNVGFERGTEYTTVLKDVLQDTFGQKIDVAEPVFDGVKKFDQALVAVTDSLNKQNVKLKENLKVIDNKSSDRSYSGTVVGDDVATGTYRGELDYPQMRGSHFGETDVTDFVESGPENPPGRNDILSQGMGPRGTGGIGAWWNRNISGHLARVGKEVFDPTEMQYRVQGNIEMPIGAVGYQTEEQRAQLESNRREYNTYGDDLKARVREQFGDVLGNLDIDELVKVTQGTKQADRRFATGVNVDEKGNVTADTKPMQVTVGTIQVNATALQSKLQGKMNADEFDARMQRTMRPSAGAMAGIYDNFGFEQFKDGEQIQKATVNVSRFHEEVKKVNMTQTGLYKMGDILRGLSWRFASLGMSAMGVYFSIQGLMMTFQQGIGAITTPLADIEALMKNIGMSTAFGDGIMNASKAMEQLNVGRDDFIDGWKNLTNIQGTIQTLFASIGTKIFGGEKGKEFTNELLSGITDAFDELDKGGITEVVRDLLSSIVEALPAILPAIKTITGMLQEMAKNKALVSMGAQLMMLSLVVQPLASGLAAIVTILGGMFTFGNLFNVFAKGFLATAVASEAAAGGITAMGIALRVLTAATVIGGVILLYEVVANLANALNLLGDFKLPTLTGWALNAMSGGSGFAAGGEIGGTPTAAIDDKTINVEEGEFVVKKDVAQRHRRELAQFNKTGVWPGSQKMAGGGFLGPSMGTSVSAVESTYQSNKTATLMEDGNRYGYNTQQVLTDVQNGDTLNVTVKNWPAEWGNGGAGGPQLPFDIGYPYRENINPTMFQPNFKGFIPNPVVDNTQGITPTWDRDTTGLTPDVNAAPDSNTNPTGQPNPNTQGTTPTGITPTSSALNYIGQIINQAFDQVVEAFQNAVDGVVKGFFAVMEAAHSAAESIANFAGAIGQSLGNMSAKPLVDFFKGTGDNEGTPTSGGLGFRANSGDWLGGLRKTDYEDLLYNHGGYTKYGDKTNYLADSTKRSGVIDQYRKGRILPQGALPDGMEGLGPRMREIWPTKQLIRKDFPYDYGEVGRALTTGDPYQVALAGASATASNAIVGGVGKGLQYGALRMGGTLTGGALARAGASFSQLNMMGGNPLVFAGAHYLESGQAFDEFMEGRSTEDLKTGEFNAVTGALTGGFSTAGFGKGMDVWGSFFGLDENQMRERLKANEGLFKFGIKDINPFNVGFGDEAWDAGWDKLKGGNRAVSDILESASFKVGDFDIGKGAGDIASAVNKGVFDAIQQAMNLDVGTIFGAGTSAIGIGAGLVETAGNTAQMAMENPWSMAQLGITAGVPLIGPFLAAMGMPQTTDWITNTKGYGSQDVTPDTWREAISDPLINQLPAAFTTANAPVVSGLDTVNQSIIAGNASTISAIQGINIQVQPTKPTTTPAFANGGVIGGKSTSAIDDKVGVFPNGSQVRVDEGEFIVNKNATKQYLPELMAINSTNGSSGNIPGLDAYGKSKVNLARTGNLYNTRIGINPKSSIFSFIGDDLVSQGAYGVTKMVGGVDPNRQFLGSFSEGGLLGDISNGIIGGSFLQAPVQIGKSLASNTEFVRLLKETVKYSRELSANAHKINPTSTLKIDMSKVVKPTGGLVERGLMDNAGSLIGKFLPSLPKMIMGGVASAIMMADPVGKGQNQKGSEASQGGSILNPYWFTDMGNLKTLPEVTKTGNDEIVSAIKTNADKQFDAMMRYNEVVGQIARDENGNYIQRSVGFEKQYKERQIDALVKYAQELTAIGDASYSDEITNIYKQIAALAPDQSIQIQKAMEMAKQFGPTSSNKGYVYMQNFKRDESEYNQWGTGDVWAGIPNRFGGNSGMSIPNLGLTNSNGMPWWSINTDPMHGAYSDAQKSLNDVYISKYGNYVTDPNGNKYSMGGGSIDTGVSKYYSDYSKTHPPPEYIGEVPEWSEGGISVGSKEPRMYAGGGGLNGRWWNEATSQYEQLPGFNGSSNKDLSMVQSPASGYLNQQQTITQTQPITVQISVSGDELATKGYVEKTIEVQVPRVMANNRSPTVGNY